MIKAFCPYYSPPMKHANAYAMVKQVIVINMYVIKKAGKTDLL